MKINDLQPFYEVTVVDAFDDPYDLTAATIVCTLKNVKTGEVKINRQSAGIFIADQSTNKGEFVYEWQINDTNVVGVYNIEFEINPPDGKKFTIPPNDKTAPAVVFINESLDTI